MNPDQILNYINIPLAILTLILTILNIYQFFQNQSESKNKEFLLTNWHNSMEGIRNALFQIVNNPSSFTNKHDVISAVNVLTQVISSNVQSMEEQRFFPGKKALLKRQERQEKFEKQMKELQTGLSKRK